MLPAHGDVARPGPRHEAHCRQRHDGDPGEIRLSTRDDDGGQQRTDRVAAMPADLEDALGEALLSGGGVARHARRLGVEDGRADADEACRQQDRRIAAGEGKAQEAAQRGAHAGDHGVRPGPAVGDVPDEGLQEGGSDLKGERDHADVQEVEAVGRLEQRIHGRDHRLNQVVEEMRAAQREQDRQERPLRGADGGRNGHGATFGRSARVRQSRRRKAVKRRAQSSPPALRRASWLLL